MLEVTKKNMYETHSLTNPLSEDFVHTWDKEEYTVPAKSTERFPLFLCIHLAKHLADKILVANDCYMDQIKGDKRTYKAVSIGEKQGIMEAVIDQEEAVELNELAEKAEKAAAEPKVKPTPEEPVAEVKEDPIKEDPTKAEKEAEEKVKKEEEEKKAKAEAAKAEAEAKKEAEDAKKIEKEEKKAKKEAKK